MVVMNLSKAADKEEGGLIFEADLDSIRVDSQSKQTQKPVDSTNNQFTL